MSNSGSGKREAASGGRSEYTGKRGPVPPVPSLAALWKHPDCVGARTLAANTINNTYFYLFLENSPENRVVTP